jgi:hypothetical protein
MRARTIQEAIAERVGRRGWPNVPEDGYVLAAAAAARDVAERDVDCPLGAAVLEEAAYESSGDAALAAARRVLDGRAAVLSHDVVVDAIRECCRRRLVGAGCPLAAWLAPRTPAR